MLAHDQLTTERNKGAVFDGFMEAPIDFKPTYKFDPLTPESDNRVRRNRQWTLKGRPKSMLNFSIELTPMPPATLYRLEHNKSCPTLSLGANDDAKYPNIFSLKRSLELQDSSKPTESGNANDGSCDNMKGKGHENKTKIEEERRVATETEISNDAQRHHNKTLGRKLSISRAFKSVHRRPSAVRTLLSPPHQHKRRHSVCFKIEDAAFDDLHDGQTQESRKQGNVNGSSMTLHDGCVSHEKKERQLEKEQLLEMVRYDTSSKQRVPSWTDRILWKSTGGNYYLPLEIGDNTRSTISGRRGWNARKKSRPKAVDGQPLSQHDEEAEETQLPGSISDSGSGPVLRLTKKKFKDSSPDSKIGLLESLKVDFQNAGSKKRRESVSQPMLSEEDEDRAAVIVKQYTAHHDVGLFSDHRPVTAVFAVRFDWDLTDRGVIGGHALQGGREGFNRWSPLGKVLEKMAS